MDALSPELVLVDPEIAAGARLALPVPGDCLAPSRYVPRPAAPVAELERRRRTPSFLAALAALLIASLIGTPDIAHLLQHVGVL